MATSGTFTFNLDIGEIMEEAFDRCGLELRSGHDYDTARRSLNLLMLEWQNMGLNLFTMKEGSQALTQGTTDYALDADELDVVTAVLRKNAGDVSTQTDRRLRRISMVDYAYKSNKLTQSEPNVFAIEKDPAQITMKLWPSPDGATTYTVVYWYLERIEDVGSVESNNMDVPPRFLPSLCAGLALKIAMKRGLPMYRVTQLQQDYDRQMLEAQDADREKANLRVRPNVYRYH